MRVIAGTARRLLLKTLDGLDTRPTTDRIKETLFNILQDEIYGCKFLDLFAGSGGIGIEASSRGALEAVFVDSNRKAADIIRQNLASTHLEDKAKVICADASAAIARMSNHGPFDLIFMDPPYGGGLEKTALLQLQNSPLVNEDTLVILETSVDSDMSWTDTMGFTVTREKKYKTNKHVFMNKGSLI